MTDALTSAAKALVASHVLRRHSTASVDVRAGIIANLYNDFSEAYHEDARAAILSFLDGIDPTLVTEAWRSGFASALDNIPEGRIGAINDALGKSASLAVLSVLRTLVQAPDKKAETI